MPSTQLPPAPVHPRHKAAPRSKQSPRPATPPPPSFGEGKQHAKTFSGGVKKFLAAGRSLLNIGLLLLTFIGGGHVYNTAHGDGKMPKFQVLAQAAPRLYEKRFDNTTAGLPDNAGPNERWEALRPTIDLLRSISPEIAEWVKAKHEAGKIEYTVDPRSTLLETADDGEIIATEESVLGDNLRLAQGFWRYSDADKAATLVHEYRHSRQNAPKVIAVMLTELLSGKLHVYGSQLENEAFLYQLEAYRAMDVSPSAIQENLDAADLTHGNSGIPSGH